MQLETPLSAQLLNGVYLVPCAASNSMRKAGASFPGRVQFIRDPIERFGSILAHLGCSSTDDFFRFWVGQGDKWDKLHYWPQVQTTNPTHVFRLEDFEEVTGVSLPRLNATPEKPSPEIDERVRRYYAADFLARANSPMRRSEKVEGSGAAVTIRTAS